MSQFVRRTFPFLIFLLRPPAFGSVLRWFAILLKRKMFSTVNEVRLTLCVTTCVANFLKSWLSVEQTFCKAETFENFLSLAIRRLRSERIESHWMKLSLHESPLWNRTRWLTRQSPQKPRRPVCKGRLSTGIVQPFAFGNCSLSF